MWYVLSFVEIIEGYHIIKSGFTEKAWLKFATYCGKIRRDMLQLVSSTIFFTKGIRVERKGARHASGLVKSAHAE